MKRELTQQEQIALLPKIVKVLETGEKWKDENLHYPAGAIIDSVMTIIGMTKPETEKGNGKGFDTNGWQWDWWQTFIYNEKEYMLTGSGYYGGHSFEPCE